MFFGLQLTKSFWSRSRIWSQNL